MQRPTNRRGLWWGGGLLSGGGVVWRAYSRNLGFDLDPGACEVGIHTPYVKSGNVVGMAVELVGKRWVFLGIVS